MTGRGRLVSGWRNAYGIAGNPMVHTQRQKKLIVDLSLVTKSAAVAAGMAAVGAKPTRIGRDRMGAPSHRIRRVRFRSSRPNRASGTSLMTNSPRSTQRRGHIIEYTPELSAVLERAKLMKPHFRQPLIATRAGKAFTGTGFATLWRRDGCSVAPLVSNSLILARPERFELPTPGFVGRCSIQLSYGRVVG